MMAVIMLMTKIMTVVVVMIMTTEMAAIMVVTVMVIVLMMTDTFIAGIRKQLGKLSPKNWDLACWLLQLFKFILETMGSE